VILHFLIKLFMGDLNPFQDWVLFPFRFT